MINTKPISRKKSTNLISTKQPHSELQRKTSTALLPSSKPKKQQKTDQIFKKTKQEKKLVHSTSKGKLNRKHLKSERTDENFNSLNHKKSVQKIQYSSKPSKEVKTKRISEQITYEKRQQKPRIFATEHTLIKTNSEAKLNVKKVNKKRANTKEVNEQKEQQKQRTITKTLQRNPTSKKTLNTKSKLKHPSSSSMHTQSQTNQRKSTKQKIRMKKKISEIIQKSILYSEVNYEFKEQISLLGSGIKKEQDFFIPYPFHHSSQSEFMGNKQAQQRRRIQNNAAVMIQKHFRGYIQRKYIEEARYIIECIKRIQRFWRKCLGKKKLMKKQEITKALQTVRGETSTSLITIKDFNDTCRVDKRHMVQMAQQHQDKIQSTSREQANKDALKDIIKNLLSEETLNQNIKEKIRSAMLQEHTKKPQNPDKKQQNQDKKPNPKQLTLKTITQESDCPLDKSRESYVKKKINMEINSQRCFNSPMNSSNSQFMTSPGMKKPASPKCLSSSFSKQVKGNYNNYFKSNKNAIFSSPNKTEESNTDRKSLRSHSGSKRQKQNCIEQLNKESIARDIAKDQGQLPFEFGKQLCEQVQPNNKIKEDYLFNTQICTNSPIFKCDDQSVEEINLLSTQKIQLSTRRAPRPIAIKPFPTEFGFIEEFCLLITDYLREEPDTTEIFMEKVKGLKYFKIDKIFKQWDQWQFQQMASQNQPLKKSILKHAFDKPSIFSKPQRSLIVQYPSLRLFLNQNDYSDSQIFNQSSAQSAYIKFMFDAFQECMYDNYKQITIRELRQVQFRENRRDIDYLSIVFSETMGNMLRSAQMLCGSFQNEDMTQFEKEERRVMNDMREGEILKQFREERFDVEICEMWINLLVSKMVFDQLVSEVSKEILRK